MKTTRVMLPLHLCGVSLEYTLLVETDGYRIVSQQVAGVAAYGASRLHLSMEEKETCVSLVKLLIRASESLRHHLLSLALASAGEGAAT